MEALTLLLVVFCDPRAVSRQALHSVALRQPNHVALVVVFDELIHAPLPLLLAAFSRNMCFFRPGHDKQIFAMEHRAY